MAETPSEWHILSFLQAITGCCSNFVGKIGRANVTMMLVSLLTLTEIVFETKTLVDAIKRKNVLLRPYVIFYALSNVAEISYFTVWFYVFYYDHSTPVWMHLSQNLIAIALEMPLMCTAWFMLPGLPGKVNYDDVFWDMILLATFLCNAWLSMCFKLWDILSTIQEEEVRGFFAVVSWFFIKPTKIIVMSSFHTIFVFTPIVYITGNFRGIANDNDTKNLMEIIRFPGENLLLLSFLFVISLLFYIKFYRSLCHECIECN